MKLNYRTIGEGEPLVILHGVFGSSDNWQTVGKILAEFFKIYLVDLRNHGKSPHSEVFTLDSMAKDVVELLDDEHLEKAHLIGHSMGGKVGMNLAIAFPERINRLIVVDIAPKYYPPHHQQIFQGFDAINLTTLTTRKEADEQMAKVISNPGVRQFILKNLDRDENGLFRWKLNLPVVRQEMDSIGIGLDERLVFNGTTLFIRGDKSDYIQDSDFSLIQTHFPNSTISTVSNAGHWVHAEQPQPLADLVINFLAK